MLMKKTLISGIAAAAAVIGMTGCGLLDTLKETNAPAATSAAVSSAPASETASETTAAAAPAAPDPALAETTAADSGNEFLDNLNKQMEAFSENVGTVTVEKYADAPAASDTPAPAEPTEAPDSLADNELLASLGERQRVGKEKRGFIDVPVNWNEFREEGVPEGQMVQYSNGTGSQVITMTSYEMMVAQQVADMVYDKLEADPACTITGSRKCEFEGREAYRVDCKYSDDMNQDMSVWLIQGEDGLTYYLAIEYTDPAVFELARTYSMTK